MNCTTNYIRKALSMHRDVTDHSFHMIGRLCAVEVHAHWPYSRLRERNSKSPGSTPDTLAPSVWGLSRSETAKRNKQGVSALNKLHVVRPTSSMQKARQAYLVSRDDAL